MDEQLILDLPVRPALGRSDFFVAPSNAEALAAIESWTGWPGGKLVLIGPEGSGKSHLAHVWAALAGARIVSAPTLDAAAVPDLAEAPAVVVEDADRAGIDAVALLHLHNLAAERRVPLLITATRPPRDGPVALPDLRSRMEAAPVARLAPPDDSLLAAVILKLFSDRQIAVSPELVTYLVGRIERTFTAARDAVTRLDKAALAEGRPVTRALAVRVLGLMDKGRGAGA